MLHMPSPMLMGGEQLTPYQRFQAHIRTRSANVEAPWASNQSAYADASYYSTATGAEGGTLRGSCWAGRVFNFTYAASRLARHAMPSAAVFTAVNAAQTDVFFRTTTYGDSASLPAYSRNGLTSTAGAVGDGPWPSLNCPEFLYWLDDQAWSMNPQAGTGPTLYVVP